MDTKQHVTEQLQLWGHRKNQKIPKDKNRNIKQTY